MIRAKLRLVEVARFSGGGGRVKFQAEYSHPHTEEDKAFWNATPSGSIELQVKEAVIDRFELGQQYYVDFTPVPAETPPT